MSRFLVNWFSSDVGRPFEVLLGVMVFPVGMLFSFGAIRALHAMTTEERSLVTLLVVMLGGCVGWFFIVVGWRLIRGKSGRADGGLLPPWCLEVAGVLFLFGSAASLVGGSGGALLGLGLASLFVAAWRRSRRPGGAQPLHLEPPAGGDPGRGSGSSPLQGHETEAGRSLLRRARQASFPRR